MPVHEVMNAAAAHLKTAADDLKLVHTVRGEWEEEDFYIREEYEELVSIADRLKRFAHLIKLGRRPL